VTPQTVDWRTNQHTRAYADDSKHLFISPSKVSIDSSSSSSMEPLLQSERPTPNTSFPAYSNANANPSDLPTYPGPMTDSATSLISSTASDMRALESTSYNLETSGLLGRGDPLSIDISASSQTAFDRDTEAALPFGMSEAMFEYNMSFLQPQQTQHNLSTLTMETFPNLSDFADLNNRQVLDSGHENRIISTYQPASSLGPQSQSYFQQQGLTGLNLGNLDLMSMWSNAPDGFRCAASLRFFVRESILKCPLCARCTVTSRLEEWDAYLTSVGELMHQSEEALGGATNPPTS
jgi:hypothetical protein